MEKDIQLFSFLIDEDTIDDVNLYAFILPNEVREIIESITRSDDKYKAIANKSIYKIATSILMELYIVIIVYVILLLIIIGGYTH